MRFCIFTSEGFVVSTFRQSQPLVGQDGDFGTCRIWAKASFKHHAYISSAVRSVQTRLSLHLHPYFVHTSGEVEADCTGSLGPSLLETIRINII